MEATLNLWGTKPTKIEIKATPVKAGSGNYTRVEVVYRGQQMIDHIPDMYPGDQLELTLRF